MNYYSKLGSDITGNEVEQGFYPTSILASNQYRTISLIGQGGFGTTFKAVNADDKICVLKEFTFIGNPTNQQTAIDLFQKESQHLRDLGNHPQIPSLIDNFTQDSKFYMVQEFVDGQNLEQELATDGKFSEAQVHELLASLLPVLDFLHTQAIPVIHRDIKPANIIRRRSDRVLVLVDFGAAKLASDTMLAKTGTSIGSAEYVAIEQARGKAIFASDIYSLGVSCIHLLTNASPFDLYSPSSEDGWAWRDFLGSNLGDEALGEVLDKMIAQNPNQRYRSAKEVMEDLNKTPEKHLPATRNSFNLVYPWFINIITIMIPTVLGVAILKAAEPLSSKQVSNQAITIKWADDSINIIKQSDEKLDEQNKVIEGFAESTLVGLLSWKVESISKKPNEYLNFGEGKSISIMLDRAPASLWKSLKSVHPDMRRQTLMILAKTFKEARVETGKEVRWQRRSVVAKKNDQGYWDVEIHGNIKITNEKGIEQAIIPFDRNIVVTRSGAAKPSSPLFLMW
jgi:serine/threonine protein kinase